MSLLLIDCGGEGYPLGPASKLPPPAVRGFTLVSSWNSDCARGLLGKDDVGGLALPEFAKGISFAKCTSSGLTQSFFIDPAVPGLVGVPGRLPSAFKGRGTGGPIGPEIFGRPPFKFGFEETWRRLLTLGRLAEGGASSTMDDEASGFDAKGARKDVDTPREE